MTADGAPSIHVLLVEDDQRVARLTAEFLKRSQLAVTCVANGAEALRLATRQRFDAIVLDLMLPGCNGLEFCRRFRERSDTPIIIATALGTEADRIVGLEMGADDYMVKPFSARELLARIRGVVRRARGELRPIGEPIRAGDLWLDPASLKATIAGRELDLTAHEFALLRALAERAGRVLSREQLLELAHQDGERVFERSIDVTIWRLRQKLGDDAKPPRILKTVRGAGYVLALERAAAAE